MAVKKINLLPKEFVPGKAVTKPLKVIRQVSYLFLAGFAIIIALGFGSVYYYNNELKNVITEQDRLKNSIQSLQETEQQLILTKDRIAKIQSVLSTRSVEDKFSKQKIIIDNLPDKITLQSAEIRRDRSILDLQAINSRDLVNFIASVSSRTDFNQITMDGLNFNSFRGYTLSLQIY